MEVAVPPLTPYLVVSNAAEAIEFYKKAFGATQDGVSHVMPGTEKIMHARLIINGATFEVSNLTKVESGTATPVFDFTNNLFSTLRSPCISGSTSMIS